MGGSASHFAFIGKMERNARVCNGEEREAGSLLAMLPLFLALAAAARSWWPRGTSAGPVMPRAG